MDRDAAHACILLAEAFRYPAPGHLAALKEGLSFLPPSSEKKSLDLFIDQISRLSLGAWEELHTRTLDLNPPAAPYIGFQTWGESYQRGAFLSTMSREMAENDIETDGELPDHLVPVLRYLAQAPAPQPELLDVLIPALERMEGTLRKAEPGNPYLYLLEAAEVLCKGIRKEPA